MIGVLSQMTGTATASLVIARFASAQAWSRSSPGFVALAVSISLLTFASSSSGQLVLFCGMIAGP